MAYFTRRDSGMETIPEKITGIVYGGAVPEHEILRIPRAIAGDHFPAVSRLQQKD